jgi:glutamate dehydrogenase
MQPTQRGPLSSDNLKTAIQLESQEFEYAFTWLKKHLPPSFTEELDFKTLILIARNLMSFQIQDYFSLIHLKHMAIVLCLDGPEADLKILKNFSRFAICHYRTFVSDESPPGGKTQMPLRIGILYFRDEPKEEHDQLEPERRTELIRLIKEKNKEFHVQNLETLLHALTPRFVRSLKNERLAHALNMFFRAKTRDECQYEVMKNEDWAEKNSPSLQIVFAWKEVPKSGFLYRLAKIIYNHGLALRKVAATYVEPYKTNSIVILSLGLHGLHNKAAWEEADIEDFLREMCLLKFETEDVVSETFVKTGLLTGNHAHLIRNVANFVHQSLLYADPNLFSYENVYEGLCRHPELTVEIVKTFEAKFHPQKHKEANVQKIRKRLLQLIEKLDTGQASNDARRKNILKQALNFIDHTLKTNFYRNNKSSFSFRLDPAYLNHLPYFIGFNIRFKDLARGGVRTVIPERWENFFQERNNIFSEAYNLAYTQQKKNKDIPEGGAKTAILLSPFDVFAREEAVYVHAMQSEGIDAQILEENLKIYRREHKLAYLYASQRSFIESLMTIINCDEKGRIKARDIIDYWQHPEYIYLGPDENMLNEMIAWIAGYSVRCGYKPGRSFMSSKPGDGINHKEYGVTSFGVNVYLHQALLFLGIDPEKQAFTIKISGGPDGDVAGNEIHILATRYSDTAKLLALTDVSGTIYDPEGLDWGEMDLLFKNGQAIRHYPVDKLHEGGFLLDLQTKREEGTYIQQTLCICKKGGQLVQDWLSGNEMNHLYRSNVHQVKTDAFIPCGGRPRTLNETNISSYLDETGNPTSKAIIEGANLYLSPGARRNLENLDVIVLKDSSCNKGGVICSSFEVLAGLCLSEEEFLHEKAEYVREVLEIIRQAAFHEANLILETHKKTGDFYTDISDKISEQINLYKYQLLNHLEHLPLSNDYNDPLIQCLFRYCPMLLRKKYKERILKIPDIHKKAIIAVFLAARLVYTRGIDWSPNIADVLTTAAKDPKILASM